MEQYLNLLDKVTNHGYYKPSARKGMPGTYEVFGEMLRFDLTENFPILTTKKVYFKGVVAELLWFLKGKTNIHYLLKNNVHIWDDDAYKYYLRLCKYQGIEEEEYSKERFIKMIESCDICITGLETNIPLTDGSFYHYGDLGFSYGHQWTYWEHSLNQLEQLIDGLIERPNSRYHVVTAWNPNQIFPLEVAVPPCHILFQCNVRNNKYLDLIVTQRSCDIFLGLPFNISSYALLNHLICRLTGYEPGELIWVGNSIHLYENHIEAAKEQLKRKPLNNTAIVKLKEETCKYKNLWDFEVSDIILEGYQSLESIKAPLSVGI